MNILRTTPSKIFLSALIAIPAMAVTCTNNSKTDPELLQKAVNGGGTVAVSGTCNFTTSTLNINNKVSISGPAKFLGNQSQILEINSDNVSINGVTFEQGYVAFGGANNYSNFVFTNNTIQDLWSGGSWGGPTALSGPGLISSNISNNTFTNLWGGESPGYPNPAPADSSGCPGQDCWGSCGISFHGLDQTTISNNTFSKIATDGMHLDWEAFTGNVATRSSSNNVIAYNTFTNIRRIPIEIQSQPSGNCPGGCNYNVVPTSNLQVKGNYAHDYALPYYDTWGASLVPDGVVNPVYINNTFIANPGNTNGYAACMESSSRNGVTQGNVCASVAGAPKFFGGGIAQGGGSNSSYTSTYQNNVFCGNPSTTVIAQEGGARYASIPVWRYNYTSNTCPAGANLTTSKIVSAVEGKSASGSNLTVNISVVSNLSIKYVQWFVDSSTKPVATTEMQDMSATFGTDRKWRYHLAINAANYSPGTHTLKAKAIDVAGAYSTISTTFTGTK